MIRAAEYPVDLILPYIGGEAIQLDGDRVGVGSLRMRCFGEEGLVCKRCGLVGVKFAKEKSHPRDSGYHLNLYALDAKGHEVLMTHDHIVPRSKGGKNHISNVQTMCMPCNSLKGNGSPHNVRKMSTGVEKADALLSNLYNTMERSGSVRLKDLDEVAALVRSTVVGSIHTRAIKEVAAGQRPADFDTHHKRVIEVAPNVVIVPDSEDPAQECRYFYILNVKTGDRIHVSFRG